MTVTRMVVGIDTFVLDCFQWCLGFCEANFSWTQKWIERVVIAVITITGLLMCFHDRWLIEYFGLFWLEIFLWRGHKAPSAKRIATEYSMFARSMRVWYLWWSTTNFLLMLCIHDFSGKGFVFNGAMTAIVYLMAIPWDTDGKRKRHKKLSLAKAIGLFGTSWIERPLGAH